MKRYCVSFLLLLLFSVFILKAQNPPCQSTFKGVTFESAEVASNPPLSIYMPYDVMLGYIAIDSVARYANKQDMIDFLSRQTYNDTIKTIMKYYYETVDYDPITFKLNKEYGANSSTPSIISPKLMEKEFLKKLTGVSPYPNLDLSLLRGYIISHVRVTDTLNIHDSLSIYQLTVDVTCQIIDEIKGQTVPACKNLRQQQLSVGPGGIKTISLTALNPAMPDTCFQFLYCPDWGDYKESITMDKPLLRDSTGQPIIKTGKEYIIFLEPFINCRDSQSHDYSSSLFPLNISKNFSMYEIRNGYVLDPYNYLGFGNSVLLNDFKNLLRQRISNIKNLR